MQKYTLLFLVLIVPLVSFVPPLLGNNNKGTLYSSESYKCVILEGNCLLKANNSTEILKLDARQDWDEFFAKNSSRGNFVLTTRSGRVLFSFTERSLLDSELEQLYISFLKIISSLHSGIYALHHFDKDFIPSVGDTSDNAAGTGDFNGDGYDDVVIGGGSGFGNFLPHLYLSDGNGGLINDSERLPQIYMNTADIIVFDADGDTTLDIFFVNNDQRNRLFINDGNGYFADESDFRIPPDTLSHTSGDYSDIDGDTDNDLLITGFDASGYGELESYNMILVNDGNGIFSDESTARFLDGTVLDLSQDGTFIDIENDNDPDMLISNDNALNHRTTLYLNNGSGYFSDVTDDKLPVLLGSSWKIAVGDLIPDQYPDVYIANAWNELNFLLENDGNGTFYDVSALRTPYRSFNDSGFSTACSVFDVDLDSYDDIVIGNSIDIVDTTHLAQNRLLINDGIGFFTDVTDSEPPYIPIIEDDTWDLDELDANNDGNLDLFVTNGYSNSVLYLNIDGILPVEDELNRPHTMIPKVVSLHQNYPNPFNPTTTISFDVPEEKQHVKLTVYDLRGRHVKTLVDEKREPGKHQVVWDGKNDRGEQVSSGIYLYTLKSGDQIYTRKMVVVE